MDELNSANKIMLRMLQDQHFNKEKVSLQNEDAVYRKIKLRLFQPFLDKDNVIRVGGRLKCSILVYNHENLQFYQTC